MGTKTLESSRLLRIALAIVATMALALAIAVHPAVAFAKNSSSSASASSSESASAEDPASPESLPAFGGLPMQGNDYVWLGRNLNLHQHSVENDLVAAGQSIHLANITVGGSFRVAAQDIEIEDSTATENITAAAERVVIKNTTANSISEAGRTASFTGSCNELTIYAEKVYINGTVEGDVVVNASSVEVMGDARIKGTLHVNAPSEPVIQHDAEVGKVDFTLTESSSNTGGLFAGMSVTFLIIMAIVGVIGTIIISVLAEWLFRRQTAGAAEMIRNRTGATIGSGIIGALVAPLVIIILCVLVITLPVAGALALALFAMTIVAEGFMGASLFKLVFPRLGRFPCALAGGAIIGVASVIPILGAIVGAAAFMYLLGYVLQSIFLGMRAKAPRAQAAPQQYPPTPPAPPMPPTPSAPPTPPTYPAPPTPPMS